MKVEATKIERGSSNVFKDLGFPDADEHLLKAELVARIDEIICQRGLKQVKATKLLSLSPPSPDISRIEVEKRRKDLENGGTNTSQTR